MKITEIDYTQVKSLGNNESCRAAVKVVLEDGESADKAFEVAKACVRRQLGAQEKQKEEDKEKNRQREAMKTKITDGPVYGYATVPTPPLRKERPAQPTPNPDDTWDQYMRTQVNREVTYHADRNGLTVRPTMQATPVINTVNDQWQQLPPLDAVNINQEIMLQIRERMARQTDAMMMGGATGGHAGANIGVDIGVAAGGGGAGEPIPQDIDLNAGTGGQRFNAFGQPVDPLGL